jgi:hypothetical protein
MGGRYFTGVFVAALSIKLLVANSGAAEDGCNDPLVVGLIRCVEIVYPPSGIVYPSKGAGSYWTLNGSVLRLVANGQQRKFVFITPREGLRKVGVTEGAVEFEGKRLGYTYDGTAHVFSQKCGAIPFHVSGEVGKDDRSVTLRGIAPLVGPECRISGRQDLVLTLEFVEN